MQMRSEICIFDSLYLVVYLAVASASEDCHTVIQTIDVIRRSEYQCAVLNCVIDIRKRCRNGQLQLKWLKDNREMFKEEKDNIKREIRLQLKFYDLKKEDTGNYTCLAVGEKINFSYVTTLHVSDGDPDDKEIQMRLVPRNTSLLMKGMVYWMPTMSWVTRAHTALVFRTFVLRCQFYTPTFVDVTVNWYTRPELVDRRYERLLTNGSEYETSTFQYYCDMDECYEGTEGFCFSTELTIRKVMPSQDEYFSCVIDGHLKATHRVITEYDSSSMLASPVQDTSHSKMVSQNESIHDTEMKMTFNPNSTICEGDSFSFHCLKNSNGQLFLLLMNDSLELILDNSTDDIHYHLNYSSSSASGCYVCRWRNYGERRMHLKVFPCVKSTTSKTVPLAILIVAVVLGVLICTLIFFVSRVRQAIQLRDSQRVYIMRRVLFKEVIANPNYLHIYVDSQWEISRDRVTISGVKLGEGNFGVVYRGMLDSKEVAIKIASSGGHAMLVGEVQMMQQLGHHRHVLELIGVCTRNGPLLAIMELATRGSLKIHLQESNPRFHPGCDEIGTDQLLIFALQIARGMEYLSSRSVVHRDLATRNILLAENGDIKIADFGLTRIVINYYHSTSEDSCPFRWMAPECFVENKFTVKSDVWAYGIVLWEVFSLGTIPYFNLTFNEVRDVVCKGAINDKPDLAPSLIFDLMKTCWRFDEDLRPTFTDIVVQLESSNVNEYV